ncbi:rod shape-determining protein RodA [Neolewinella agarilytica]|uniref:rod shape-determining protein RodA n=1 Tax=Neolewinella agarilytica TaxID=478744 RepID=UPI002354DB81|nr:rod shape-determining protein RodA [Neolewinella agarilytica]
MLPNALSRTKTDRLTIILYFLLVIGGLLMIHAVERPPDGYELDYAGMLGTLFGKQLVWFLISIAAWFGINLLIDRSVWVIGAYPIYAGTVLLLLLVLIFGKEINNARSWFSLFGFTFQPSELAKFGTCLAMAAYLSQWSEKMDRPGSILNGVALWAIPAALIILQPDPGSALVFSSFLLVMYREGLPRLLLIFGGFSALMFILGILQPPAILAGGLLMLLIFIMSFFVPRKQWLWIGGAAATAAAAIFLLSQGVGWPVLAGLLAIFIASASYHLLRKNRTVVTVAGIALVWGVLIATLANFTFNNVLMEHQQNRINAWLRPEGMNERGELYNVIQAKLAIAAGGLTGKGRYGGTMTRYDYVPEQETDFIFTAVGEAYGFMGSFTVIMLFLFLLWRLSIIAERQKLTFARAYAYGVVGIILIHVLVNIGMTMGLMPVIGIPLPFLSKGGSSLLSFTIMIAVLLKLDRHRETV